MLIAITEDQNVIRNSELAINIKRHDTNNNTNCITSSIMQSVNQHSIQAQELLMSERTQAAVCRVIPTYSLSPRNQGFRHTKARIRFFEWMKSSGCDKLLSQYFGFPASITPSMPHTHTVGYATTNDAKMSECYNEEFLSMESGCYNERGGILSTVVARTYTFPLDCSRFLLRKICS